ncbi:cyclase family protein [Brevibacillus nitrificans]|uniref:Cyclase family protein n=1 Tax=Brevibacillus nitrificans TaxID=651560 RepID=A0A3M8DM84_9BACL|nr:cyclase family protein [Brevibacillus nitrificans]RNB88611.1 cyclase family protein [Brevibacillus nitrificans]
MTGMRKKQRFIDLSVAIRLPVDGELRGDLAPVLAADIQYISHRDNAELSARMWGATLADLPGGLGYASEQLNLSSHAGTHLDAPYHYHPTSEGAPAKTIDEIPLEELYGHGVRLDLRHKKPGENVSLQDIKDALAAIDYTIQPGDIVYLWFDADKTFGTADYWNEYPGMGAEATRYLLDQGVKVLGTDAVGFDRPFPYTAAEFQRTGDRALLWEAHFVGIEKEYYHVEKLANLDKLPPYGFTTMVFPIKLEKCSGAWCRAVAIVEEESS